jgi:hypothetical protein
VGFRPFCSTNKTKKMKAKNESPMPDLPMWKYWPLLVRPFFVGLFASFVWYVLHEKINVDRTDMGIFELLLEYVGVVYAIIVGYLIGQIIKQYRQIKRAFRKKNREIFEDYAYDTELPNAVRGMLLIFSFIVFLIFLLFPLVTDYAGIISVWIVMFLLYLIWEVANELTDPFKGISKITTEQVEQFFNPKVNHEKNNQDS